MRRLLLLISAPLATLALAQPALAKAASVETVELGRRGDSVFAARGAHRFTLAGVHWRGRGDVRFRTRSAGGRWSAWRPGAPEREDGPDPLSEEFGPAGWHVGNPWWVGESDRIQVRTVGRVTRVRAKLVWSPELRIPYRRVTAAEAPSIVSRAVWGADESIRRGPPVYARSASFSIVHHTAGRNDYSRAEAPAVVRGIQLYHVKGNGWNDIGYNFLVDRFGTVYEGRFGGVDRNVVGAHALGFNTGSVGIAVLGTYGGSVPSRAAQDAVTRLISWRLDVAHVDPTRVTEVVSAGSERHASGSTVKLRTVSGHRDTGATACPGDALYARLDAIAREARALGGLKIFEPSAQVTGSTARFRARLSQPGTWAVVVADAEGIEVARGTGAGGPVDWAWDFSAVTAGSYVWTISAGAARPATGVLRVGGAAATLEISEATAEPASITPNGDGQGDSAQVGYRLSTPASVTVEVVDAFAAPVALLVDRDWKRAGRHTITVTGDALADGLYSVVVTARTASGQSAQALVPLAVSRTLGLVGVAPEAFSPNGDGRNDELLVSFSLAVPASARVRIEREGRWVATAFAASLPAGPQQVAWNGLRAGGAALRDGSYTAVVEAQDAVGVASFGVPFVVDTVAPKVRILPTRRLRVEVNEPAVLTVRIDGRTVERQVRKAGVATIPGAVGAARIRVVASDPAGNTSAPAVRLRTGKG